MSQTDIHARDSARTTIPAVSIVIEGVVATCDRFMRCHHDRHKPDAVLCAAAASLASKTPQPVAVHPESP